MSLVGTLLFCEDCGDLVDRCPLEQRTISCNVCEKEEINRWPTAQTTMSTPGTFPSRLRDKLSDIQILSAAYRDTWTLTPKTCPKCEHSEMKFRDVCPACDYRYVTKNFER
ncbi:uncharacterized protein M437DRAFT_79557 [Aureobasidium melanogenum CBS 110374]|uniref:DNA-directed RNA polymerase subunit n=1 Tax=Aureobasidium melanogenum (strain CBS 110374) TaxID=1043003 RepID=A0A074W505_AURM1|nr:uncharacterized protein M437DRAFT_79557 [Aureobasidium melanogenum CBS 110374]KEQ57641.1 hypothetical protein M437DRAFT_79557 [Aureobasidium melanogenum CBS 110374]